MLFLAPMQSLTDLPFRKAFAKVFPCVIDFAVSPFISLTHGTIDFKSPKFKDVLPEANQGVIPVIPQILGNEQDLFLDTANALYDLGYETINWNLGCPMPRISGKKRGSGLLPYPQEIEKLLNFVLPNMKGTLSIKMRLGLDTPDEIFALIPILNQYNLESIIMHPRVGAQLYEGGLHWYFFEEFLNQIQHKVIFNGDVRTLADYENVVTRFPQIKDVMLGRGLLKNPTLASEIKGVGDTQNEKNLFWLFEQTLFQEICQTSKTDIGKLSRLKEYWGYFSENKNATPSILQEVVRTQTLQEYRILIDNFKTQ